MTEKRDAANGGHLVSTLSLVAPNSMWYIQRVDIPYSAQWFHIQSG